MSLSFRKMHGLGNDFIILDARKEDIHVTSDLIRFMSDRRRGAGCDQFVVIKPPKDPSADVFVSLYNADGFEVGACGNATRCVADMIMYEKNKNIVGIETESGGVLEAMREGDLVSVDMGMPGLEWEDIPLSNPADTLHLPGFKLRGARDPVGVSMGNPHCVFFVPDVEPVDLSRFGPMVEKNPIFPLGTNVEFVEVLDKENLRMRVWERGVGETQACGTGACAAAVAAVRRGLTVRTLTVHLDGGELDIKWREDNHVWMSGPVTYVYDGVFYL